MFCFSTEIINSICSLLAIVGLHLANLEEGLPRLFYLCLVNPYDLGGRIGPKAGPGLEVRADGIERQLEIGEETPIQVPGKDLPLITRRKMSREQPPVE